MRKRLLRLTTAMAVVVLGIGYCQPAQAQLGGMLGGVLGGQKDNNAPLDVEKSLKEAAASLGDAKTVELKGASVVNNAAFILETAGALNAIAYEAARSLAMVKSGVHEGKIQGWQDTFTRIASVVGHCEKKHDSLAGERSAIDMALKSGATAGKADDMSSDGQSDGPEPLANLGNSSGDFEKIALSNKAVKEVEGDVDRLAAQANSSASAARKVIEDVYVPARMQTDQAKAALEAIIPQIGPLSKRLDEIDKEVAEANQALVAEGVKTVAILGRQVAGLTTLATQMQSRLASLATNPGGATAEVTRIRSDLDRVTSMGGRIKRFISLIESHNANIGKANDYIARYSAGMRSSEGLYKEQLNHAQEISKSLSKIAAAAAAS
jgi:hypothetical protein